MSDRSDDWPFITLMSIAEENPAIRRRLVSVLSLDSFNRKSVLNEWVAELRMQNAPAVLIDALAALLDDELAVHAGERLAKHSPPE